MKATELNVSVLAELVAHHANALRGDATMVMMPNEIPRARFAASMNHIRRCMNAGLVFTTSRGLAISPEGIAAVKACLAKEIDRGEKRGFGAGSTEEMYKRNHEMAKAVYTWLTENT